MPGLTAEAFLVLGTTVHSPQRAGVFNYKILKRPFVCLYFVTPIESYRYHTSYAVNV